MLARTPGAENSPHQAQSAERPTCTRFALDYGFRTEATLRTQTSGHRRVRTQAAQPAAVFAALLVRNVDCYSLGCNPCTLFDALKNSEFTYLLGALSDWQLPNRKRLSISQFWHLTSIRSCLRRDCDRTVHSTYFILFGNTWQGLS